MRFKALRKLKGIECLSGKHPSCSQGSHILGFGISEIASSEKNMSLKGWMQLLAVCLRQAVGYHSLAKFQGEEMDLSGSKGGHGIGAGNIEVLRSVYRFYIAS